LRAFPDRLHRRYSPVTTTLLDSPPVRTFAPEELEELKRKNESIAYEERRTRPDSVRAWPQYLTIMNTYKCDLECPMCFKQLDDVFNMSLPDMDWSIFEKVAHETFPHLRLINLSVSGEPLVSRTIFRELELMRFYGVKTDITTNGMPLARRGLLDALVPVCHALTVSFDGGTKETFEYVRKGANWDTVLKNLRLFNSMRNRYAPEDRPIFRMNHVYQYANARELTKVVELAKDVGIDFLNVEHIYVHREYQGQTSLQSHPRLANEMIERARERAAEIGLSARFPTLYDVSSGEPDRAYGEVPGDWLELEAKRKIEKKMFRDMPPQEAGPVKRAFDQNVSSNAELVARRDNGWFLPKAFDYGIPQLGESLIPDAAVKHNGCFYPWREAFISWDGQVGPCCSPALFEAGNMGNLHDAPFSEIWNGPIYQRLRRSIREGRTYKFCRHCYIVNPEDPEAYSLC
jgi:radical SAM protein with 4Fe4S-binding SPASM domain